MVEKKVISSAPCLKFDKVKALPAIGKPNTVYYVKGENDLTVKSYITDINGNPSLISGTEILPSTFIALSDTPNSYIGHANKLVTVNNEETGLKFTVLNLSEYATINYVDGNFVRRSPTSPQSGFLNLDGNLITTDVPNSKSATLSPYRLTLASDFIIDYNGGNGGVNFQKTSTNPYTFNLGGTNRFVVGNGQVDINANLRLTQTPITEINPTQLATIDATSGEIKKVEVISFNKIGNTTTQNTIVVDGDSRPAGYIGVGIPAYPMADHLSLNIQNKAFFNTADGGATYGDFEADGVQWKQKAAYTNVDTKLSRYGWNILLIWAGYNDMAVRDVDGLTTYQKLISYCNARRKAGWKVFAFTEPATTSTIGESRRLVYNDLVRKNWTRFADGLVDLGLNPTLGAPGAASNTTYFQDGVHMTAAGYQIAADLASNVVNSYTDEVINYIHKQVIVSGSITNSTIETEDMLTLHRETSTGVSFSNAATLKLGRYSGIGGGFNPFTRLDFNLKNSLSNGYNANVNVATMFDTGQTGFGYTDINDLVDYKVGINGKLLVNNRIKSTAGFEWGYDVYQAGQSRLYNNASNGTVFTPITGTINDSQWINGAGSGVWQNPTGTQNIEFNGKINIANNDNSPTAGVRNLDLASYVTTATTQTITGLKTFTSGITSDAGILIKNGNGLRFNNSSNTFYSQIDSNLLTANRSLNWPDKGGIVATTDDLTSYVPYTGATTNLNLGGNNIVANQATFSRTTTNDLVASILIRTANVTVASGEYTLLMDATSGNLTVTLQAAPTIGRILNIKKVTATNSVTIDGNGNNIDGATTQVITGINDSITIQYSGSTYGWVIL